MLTSKQILFCNEYIIDNNARRAAIRAGFSQKRATEYAYQLKKNPEIKKLIERLQAEHLEAIGITAQKVLEEYAKIGFSNLSDFVNGNNRVLELKHLPKNISAAVKKIKQVSKIDGDGVETITAEIELHDKVQALNKMAEKLGLFEAHNDQLKTTINTIPTIVIDNPHNAKDNTDKATI